jgi:hypothetical protein
MPRPHEPCPDCGAPAYHPHLENCRWFDAYTRSKLPANEQEAQVHETPDPQPIPVPDEPDDGGDDDE